jgi:hypothetical protein
MLGCHLVLVTLYHGLQLVLSKTIRIGDTKYHIQCSWPAYDPKFRVCRLTVHIGLYIRSGLLADSTHQVGMLQNSKKQLSECSGEQGTGESAASYKSTD